MERIEIVCLANSRKMRGRCVAGLRVDTGTWLRPVSDDQDGTLYGRHYEFRDGTEAAVLDVVDLQVAGPQPAPHQPENWRVVAVRWRRTGRLEGDRAVRYLRRHTLREGVLLGNRTDRVEFAALIDRPTVASLALIEPERFRCQIRTWEGQRKNRVLFTLHGVDYDLSLTDPVWEARLRDLPVGTHTRYALKIAWTAKVFLTVSLSEPFEKTGFCYKLVAAVIVLP